MRQFLAGALLCAGSLWNSAAFALPNEPFLATAEMVATVRSVSASGRLLDANRDYVRDLTVNDLPILPWNIGDRLTVRWEQHSSGLQGCTGTFFQFGGISFPGLDEDPCAGDDAVFEQVDRADGSTSFVWDGWESAWGRGPLFNAETAELQEYF